MEMYDEEWAAQFETTARAAIAGREAIFRIANACLADLPRDARVLIVGCGTGAELLDLAEKHPDWRFEAVEPAAPMLDVCRRRLEAAGWLDRVRIHERLLGGFRTEPCDAATAILVSQHVVDDAAATGFFRDIAANLVAGGLLVGAEVSAPAREHEREFLLDAWQRQASASGLPAEPLAQMRARFGGEIALRSAAAIDELVTTAGFGDPIRVFQSLIYAAWCARRLG